jgi:hypothetical protein
MPELEANFPLIVKNAMMCEEIRAEFGGKNTLLGVYAGDILVSEVGGYLRAAIYGEFVAKTLGQFTLDGVVNYGATAIAKFQCSFDFRDIRDPGILASPPLAIHLPNESTISVDVSCEGKLIRLVEKQVRISEVLKAMVSASTVTAPPVEQSPPASQETSLPPEPSRPARPTRRRRT